MTPTVHFEPGEGTLVLGQNFVGLIGAGPIDPLTMAASSLLNRQVDMATLATLLLQVGLPQLGDFGFAVAIDGNVHLLHRGAVDAELVTTDLQVVRYTGQLVSTWQEEAVPGVAAVTLGLAAAPSDGPVQVAVEAVMAASLVTWTLRPDIDLTPQSSTTAPSDQQSEETADADEQVAEVPEPADEQVAEEPMSRASWPPPPPPAGSTLDEEFGELLGATRNWTSPPSAPEPAPPPASDVAGAPYPEVTLDRPHPGPANETPETLEAVAGEDARSAHEPATQTFHTRQPPTDSIPAPAPVDVPAAPEEPPGPPPAPEPTEASPNGIVSSNDPPAGIISQVPGWGAPTPPAPTLAPEPQPRTAIDEQPHPVPTQAPAAPPPDPSPPLAPPPTHVPPATPPTPEIGTQQPAPTGHGPVEPPPTAIPDDPPTISRPAGGSLGPSPQASATPSVQAVICPSGHPNPTHAEACRICHAPIADRTIHVVPRPTLGVLRFTTGTTVSVDGPLILGRKPATNHAVDGVTATPIPIEDAEHALSRSHLELRISDWQVQIADRDSMNGTFVVVPGRAPFRLHPGEPYPIPLGTQVNLGDVVSFTFEPTQDPR